MIGGPQFYAWFLLALVLMLRISSCGCVDAFHVPYSWQGKQIVCRGISKNDQGIPLERPPNEFSRSFRVEGILSGGSRQRDYSVKVEATEEELAKLASRFDLNKIYQLEADVSLRRERLGTTSSSSAFPGVEVEGVLTARVDQVCVRTGEVFDVDIQFPLFAVVRPIAALGSSRTFMRQQIDQDVPDEVLQYSQKDQRKNRKNGDYKKKDRVKSQSFNEMDIGELQKLLQDFDIEDDVFEDEAIYAMNGMLDLGELISQLFWLKLDPYPKKPGSSPVWTSISG